MLYPDTYGCASGVGRTPLQCVPQPPLAIPTRKDSHLIYVLHSEQLTIRHQPPTHKRTDERGFSPVAHRLPPIRAERIVRFGRVGILSGYATKRRSLQSTPNSLRRTARRGRTLSQCKPNNKVLSLHKLRDTPLCSLFRLAFQSLFRSVSSTFRNADTTPLAH